MQPYTPFYSPFTPGFMSIFVPIILVIVLWTIVLKGYALWHSARNSQKWWFIILLVINTMGILEIIYLIWFRTKTKSPIIESAPVHTSSPQ
ncbi:hypothetical protein A2609_02125 [Candidatus Kaiserbacteria bacterium RIFOXYD1_FULL_47_14]|uniref:DUF5652 domain-containing protein n=1 Tax=Candidatus Kaiserbacteria bacterium RIFOXYD1_FULL_47_14 TaxID=1798533 RepID=A0A1F6G3F1_9BACT|nr:MAG: hypothetical protein A2609_02125 [Candidatus Kaiserbacteria bacterium RIFOXYD1_FULL_47_14]